MSKKLYNIIMSDSQSRYVKNRIQKVFTMAGHELVHSKPYGWLLLGATATGLAFEWGPGNEWLIGSVGTSVHQSYDPNSFGQLLQSSALAGGATGVASAVEQSALGLLMAGSVRNFPKTFQKWDETRAEHAPISSDKNDIITGITLGTSAVVIEKNAKNPNRTYKQDSVTVAKTAGIIGIFNALLVSSLSIGVRILEDQGYEQASQNIEAIAKNPLTYLSVFGLYKAIQIAKNRSKNKKPNTIIDVA
jgi:hypothetical protein